MNINPFFLGPQSENGSWMRAQIESILDHWFEWRKSLFPGDGRAITKKELLDKDTAEKRARMESELQELMNLWQQEVPKFTPRYMGHMVSEISLPAILGHFLNLLHNPNCASREVAKVGGKVEDKAIALLGEMIGFDRKKCVGHFTSCGSIANIEAAWRARFRLDHMFSLGMALKEKQKLGSKRIFEACHSSWNDFHSNLEKYGIQEEDLRSSSFVSSGAWVTSERYFQIFGERFTGPVALIPGNKHYSWQKAISILGLGETSFWSIELDEWGRLSIDSLTSLLRKAESENRPVLMVVSVAGTTELGEVDPVEQVQDVLDEWKSRGIWIWHHVDAAYGGYYCNLGVNSGLDSSTLESFKAIGRTDSVTLDPHKLGYVPYSCGSILFRDIEHYAVSGFRAAYLDQISGPNANSKWSSTLEGSRSGSGPTATYLSSVTLGLGSKGGYAAALKRGIEARKELFDKLKSHQSIFPVEPTDTNIICFNLASKGLPLSEANQMTAKLFQKFTESPEFSVSKTVLHSPEYEKLIRRHVHTWKGVMDCGELFLLRVVLMNPFFKTENGFKYCSEFINSLDKMLKNQK